MVRGAVFLGLVAIAAFLLAGGGAGTSTRSPEGSDRVGQASDRPGASEPLGNRAGTGSTAAPREASRMAADPARQPPSGTVAAAEASASGSVTRAAESAMPRSANPPSSQAEFERRRGEARSFLARLYRDFKGREGSPEVIALWADLIASGAWTREQAVEHFLDSAGHLQFAAPLARLYFATFQRVPDEAGLSHWRSVAASGEPLGAISDAFAASGEFAAMYGSLDDAQFIDRAYRNTLGRPPSPAETTQWQSQLSSGLASRGLVLLALSDSPEFRAAVADEVNAALLYSGMLRRTADAPGFEAWMRSADQEGLTRSAMISRFLDSPEYRQRAASERVPGS